MVGRSLVAWVMLAAVFAGKAVALEAGQVAPDIELPGAGRLSDFRGQLVYLDFWASWCGPCRQSLPWMGDMQRKYAARGLRVIAVNLDARREDADRFLAGLPAATSSALTLVFDAKGDTPRRMEIKGMPSSMVIDAQGRVMYVHRGFRMEDGAALENKLLEALPGR